MDRIDQNAAEKLSDRFDYSPASFTSMRFTPFSRIMFAILFPSYQAVLVKVGVPDVIETVPGIGSPT